MPLSASLIIPLLVFTAILSGASDSRGEEPVYASLESGDEQAELDRAWNLLSDYYKAPGNIDESIAIAEGIVRGDPGNVQALLFLSRAWLTYGYVKARTKEDLVRVFGNGVEEAKKAVAEEPENPDAHFFYVANLASLGDAKGLFNSLFMLPEVRKELDTILKLDPNHAEGLAMNGALYYYLPGVLGGDLHISEIYLKRSLGVDPHLSSARLYLAANYMKQERYDEAMEQLRLLVEDKQPSFYPDWYLNRKYAYNMMRNIRDKTKGQKEVKK